MLPDLNTSSETMNVNYSNLAGSQSPQRRLLINKNYTPKWTHQDNNTNGTHLTAPPHMTFCTKGQQTTVHLSVCV